MSNLLLCKVFTFSISLMLFSISTIILNKAVTPSICLAFASLSSAIIIVAGIIIYQKKKEATKQDVVCN